MYVSRGAGTTTCPVRFFAPPEVTIVELIPEKSGD
jgi:predicted MPP superfamily phosphohydrolase